MLFNSIELLFRVRFHQCTHQFPHYRSSRLVLLPFLTELPGAFLMCFLVRMCSIFWVNAPKGPQLGAACSGASHGLRLLSPGHTKGLCFPPLSSAQSTRRFLPWAAGRSRSSFSFLFTCPKRLHFISLFCKFIILLIIMVIYYRVSSSTGLDF